MGNCCVTTTARDLPLLPIGSVAPEPHAPSIGTNSLCMNVLFEKETSVLSLSSQSFISAHSSVASTIIAAHDRVACIAPITSVLPLFADIMDDKHAKYMPSYVSTDPTLFWGIGIENETYLMRTALCNQNAFCRLRHKRERYSVDYFQNFKAAPLQRALSELATSDQLTYPIYINSHTFQRTDHRGEHRTLYDVAGTPNRAFTESLHDQLLRDVPYYATTYNKSVVFDGDSIEFITQDFY